MGNGAAQVPLWVAHLAISPAQVYYSQSFNQQAHTLFCFHKCARTAHTLDRLLLILASLQLGL